MRVLHTVESYFPARHGMQEVVSQISERLFHKGHEVTVATSTHSERTDIVINGVRIESFAVRGNMALGYGGERSEQKRYQRFLLNGDFDIVVNFAAQQWATDLMLPILNEIRVPKVFVPTGFSALYADRYRHYFECMPAWMRQYDMNVFSSHTYRDIRFAQEHGITNIAVIPNGASAEEFLTEPSFSIKERLGIPQEMSLLLLVGSHSGKKGHEEAVKIFDAATVSNVALLIIGKNVDEVSSVTIKRKLHTWTRSLYKKMLNECPAFCQKAAEAYNNSSAWKKSNKRLLFLNASREETIRAYQEADIFLFPSRVECSPVVLFEALASRTPFLATDVGNAAEIAQWSGGGRILPTDIDTKGYAHADIVASAKMLTSLLQDKNAREMLATKGHAAWRSRFTWGKIADQYEEMFRDLVEKKGN